ncbi:MAG: hypothetical protein K2M50_00565 [Treponemataceae bacterium]|nr:hypothetical protein [Treponemataceae bacterium]
MRDTKYRAIFAPRYRYRFYGGSTMQKKKAISLRYRIIPLALMAIALLCSCTDTLSEKTQEITSGGGYEYFETEDKGGSLTVAACVSNGASRHAMPTIPELVYAALLYHDESPENENFEPGTQTNGEDGNVKLVFSFQRPEDTRGTFTLEVFAFIKSDIVAEDGTTNFSRNGALLSGKKDGCAIEGDAINVSEPIELSSSEQGTVSLKIKVPDDCTLKIDDTANFDCKKDNDASDTYTVSTSGIAAGAYQVTFTVKKKVRESEEIICVFSEYINVFNGLCTDTWDGLAKGAAKEISQSMISSTVYVRGTDGWYDGSDYKDSATANDDNLGSFLSPLATIQKAIDKIIAINDGSSAYTIYVDGTLTATDTTYIGTNGMADFSAFNENLTLTIKPLSGTATLDGGAVFNADGTVETAGIDKSIIYARPGTNGALNLTLEKLVITGGGNGGVTGWNCGLTMNDCEVIRCIGSSSGGGVYVDGSGTFTMNGGTISGNTASSFGGGVYVGGSRTFTMNGGTISGNTAGVRGGGVCLYGLNGLTVNFTMNGGTISGNTTSSSGGGVYVVGGTFMMNGGTISGNTAKDGGGVFLHTGTFKMESGAISGGKAESGGGVYINAGRFTMNDGTISNNTAISVGGGIYSAGILTITGGTISNCNTTSTSNNSGGGGGIYSAGTLSIRGGMISDCTAKSGGGIYVYDKLSMSGGTISGNNASYGKGAYLSSTGKLNMSGTAQFAESDNVYIASGSNIPTITITGVLSAATPVATITLPDSAYTENRPLLSADDGVTLDGSICNKFAVTSQADGTEWRVALDGADGVLIRKYEMGDTGPGGGAVCYYNSNGFTVNGKTCHYLECSKETIGLSVWCPCTSSGWCNVTTSSVIGAGYANTQAILDHPNHASATAADCAAKLCANYSTSTTNAGEWFLPNTNEADKIYKGVSIISSEEIWSSQNVDAKLAWSVNLRSTDSSSGGTIKNYACSVRAMRAF